MFVSRFVEFAFRKTISLAFVGLLVTASFAQNAAPQSTQASMPPLTPMPQAPAPQNNAHPYSDQNYAKPAASISQCPGSVQGAECAGPEPEQFSADRPIIPRWQDLPVHQRCGGDGAGE